MCPPNRTIWGHIDYRVAAPRRSRATFPSHLGPASHLGLCRSLRPCELPWPLRVILASAGHFDPCELPWLLPVTSAPRGQAGGARRGGVVVWEGVTLFVLENGVCGGLVGAPVANKGAVADEEAGRRRYGPVKTLHRLEQVTIVTQLQAPPAIVAASAETPLLPLGDQLFQRLLRHRIIFLGQQVDDDIANRICAELVLLASEDEKRDISIYINSPGGSVYAGMAIYDIMQYVPNDIATYAMGMAAL